MAHYYLWNYPRNSTQVATRFKICEKYARGEHLWKWIGQIEALKEKAIKWTKNLDDKNTAVFAISVDGIDFKVWEKKHPVLPRDRGQFSKKHSHGAVKYELGISVFEPKLVWVNGPFRGGEHDLNIFRHALKDKVKPWKKVIVDRGYNSSEKSEMMLSQPNGFDSKELKKFKALVCC